MNSLKRIYSRSKSSLFLMEMILSLLFFALACSICVQIGAYSYHARHEARVLNHMQELSVTAAEVLEGWEGTTADYAALLGEMGYLPEIKPVQLYQGEGNPTGIVALYFDRAFNPCPGEEALWELLICLRRGDYDKALWGTLYEENEEGGFTPLDLSFETAFPLRRKGRAE